MKGRIAHMNRIKNVQWVIFIIVFFIELCGCGYAETKDEKVIKGMIYLGGQIFGKVDLESRKWEAVYTGSGAIYCEYPNVVNKNLFILETKGFQIEYFDALLNKFTFITLGIKPVYVPEINSIFYYKDREGLFKKILDGEKEEVFITDDIYAVALYIQPKVLHYSNPPIKISHEEIAYYNKNSRIEIYNFITKTFRVLDLINYEPYTFYTNKNSLLCRNKVDKKFYFINPATSIKEGINIKNPNLVESSVIAIDDYDCLIYSKFRGGPFFWESEYKDTYIYWVSEQEEEKFIENDDVSFGVYIKK